VSTTESLITIAGLALITLLTRGFFVLPSWEMPLPAWLRQGLRYAPVAALAAVVAPEVLMTDGHLIATWQDARIYAALTGIAWFFWRRGILGTIVSGTLVLVTLRLGLGW
jgi:branched-subunit amino acid transport protein